MGDKAIEEILDTFQEIEPWVENGPSVRIEHAAIMNKELLERAKRQGIALVPQIIFFYAEYDSYRDHLDDERFYQTSLLKEMMNDYDWVALSSDSPATTWTTPDIVLTNIKIAVTRVAYNGKEINKNQVISVSQAVLAYTRNGHTVCRFDDTGIIAAGNHADFVVLDQDIFTMEPMNIDKTNIVATYIGGEKVYGA